MSRGNGPCTGLHEKVRKIPIGEIIPYSMSTSMATPARGSARATRRDGPGRSRVSCICLPPPQPSRCSNSASRPRSWKWSRHGVAGKESRHRAADTGRRKRISPHLDLPPWGYHAFALLSPSDRRRRCDRDQTNADVPDPEAEGPKELITGFLFGTTGATIALSAVGKESGAHINPVVTMAFWLFRRLDSRIVIRYFGGLAGLLRTFCFCHTLIICYRTTRYVASKPFTTTWHPACSYSDHGPSNADNGGSSATQGGDHSGAAIAHAAAGDLR